jgi:hypothetical protein
MKAVILDEEAQKELNEAIEWYNDRQQRLGLELQNEVEEAVDRIRLDPGVGACYPTLCRLAQVAQLVDFRFASKRDVAKWGERLL